MAERLLRIRGIDPLLFRDGRPFAAEIGALTAESLPLPLPGTVAGLLRTHLGDAAGWTWNRAGSEKALQVSVAGPLLARNSELVFSAPADAVHFRDDDKKLHLMPLRPGGEGGCDLPHPGLRPLAITQDVKPESAYRYWPWEQLEEWLLSADGTGFQPLTEEITGLPAEERTHVMMDGAKGIGEEGKLFHAQFRSFEEHRWKDSGTERHTEWSLLARLTTDESVSLAGVSPFGGERRLAQIHDISKDTSGAPAWPICPADLTSKLTQAKQVRLVLATPALFAGGWKPGWVGADMNGEIGGVSLRLVAAATGRREPVSGWDFQARGPKPVRWMVPAGSVYFFEVTGGDATALTEKCWLQSVSDGPQDKRDGYGLALWGLW